MSRQKTIHLISLGCSKNLVDSEHLLGSAVASLNFEICPDPKEADLIVINTCAFLQSAVEEAIEHILEAGSNKKKEAKLVVVGCFASRYDQPDHRDGLTRDLPEVDLFVRPEEYPLFTGKLAELLGLKPKPALEDHSGKTSLGPRMTSTPFFRAFLKIAEGCDNHCTYCIIPKLRGPLHSYDADALLAEAEALADSGVKEVTLVAQDLTTYGRDRNEENGLLNLIRRLSKIKNLAWIRLLYAYPERLTEPLVKELAATPKVVPYLDLPFQHAAAAVLKRMGRSPKIKPLKLAAQLRKWWPGLALRTTLIVGFPGETEADFEEMLAFVNNAAIDNLGVFKFSPEEESPASRFPDQIPQIIKEKRRRKIMAAQKRMSLALNRARVGQTFPVLVEGPSPESPLVMSGRAYFQAPEVDGLIYFDGEQPAPGQIVQVRIIKASAYDLTAEWIE